MEPMKPINYDEKTGKLLSEQELRKKEKEPEIESDVEDENLRIHGCHVKMQFTDEAKMFDITDDEVELVDTILADPYRNASAAFRMLHPDYTSVKSIKVKVSNILKKPNVAEYMAWATENRKNPTIVTREYVLMRLRHVADRAMSAEPVFDKEGQPTGEYKSDFPAANKALELLGKQLGMFKDNQTFAVQHTSPKVVITIDGESPLEESEE